MLSKREYKKKKKEEQEAAAHVFQDFIETFQNSSASVVNKTFVRSSVLYAGSKERINENVGQIYKPTPLIINQIKENECSKALECAKILKDNVPDKKKHEKPKSNLDLLKEELKQRHAERGERERIKEELSLYPTTNSYESDELNTTNLFVANLNPKITENNLMLEFGAYGPLASVKILWPRGDESSRNSNCGFVAFMSRKDAERALKENQYRTDMRVCWGKSVELPSFPIYIPNSLLKLYLPPPLSGLPFNAQPFSNSVGVDSNETDFEDFTDFLATCYVKVTIPLNKKVLMLVHRMIEFVVMEGPMFEAFIMNREISNPDYNFLFDCQSPTHIYYRWKLFSILNGDCQKTWSMKKFRMFKGGSVWYPPIAPSYSTGMPDELISKSSENKLSETQSNRLIGIIRNLTMQRSKITEAMIFCLNHLNAIDDSIEIIIESLLNSETSLLKKIARLYFLSDVLSNCKSKRISLNIDTKQGMLLEAFKIIHSNIESLKCFCDKENVLSRVTRVITHWDIYKIFVVDFIEKINTVLCANKNIGEEDEDNSSFDEPLDGACLLKRCHADSLDPNVVTSDSFCVKKQKKLPCRDITEYFVPSKWDTIDPDEVEAQAMSTEKLYLMENEKHIEGTKKTKSKRGSEKRKKKKSKH